MMNCAKKNNAFKRLLFPDLLAPWMTVMGKSFLGKVANFDNVLLKCLSLDGSMENPASTEKVRQLRKEKSISIVYLLLNCFPRIQTTRQAECEKITIRLVYCNGCPELLSQ